ncbi:MAG: amidohydrolase family protein [Gemmataceae bacterium]
MIRYLSLGLVALTISQLHAADPIVFRNCTIYTGTSAAPISKGAMVVQDGKILGVYDLSNPMDVTLPKGTEVDLNGAVVIPGLVDTHSHIGIYPKPSVPAHQDGNEMSGPVQSAVRAIDAVWPADPGIRMATAGGITTANIMPGSGNVIGGQTVYVKLRGETIEEMRITGKLENGTEVYGGLKMANGENPKGYGRSKQQAPFTRMKVAALQREQFVKAKEYLEKKKKAEADKKPFDRDLAMEPLVEVLERKRTVHFHCHRADDLFTAVRLAEEFGFEIVLQHGTEGYRLADILAQKKIPVSVTLIDSPGGKAEVVGLIEENAAIMNKAGVTVCVNTDDFVTESRFFLRSGSIALRGGMSEIDALKTLTINPAKIMHLDHRIGSLEKGKDADFVILTGAPFSVYSKVTQTWIDGKKVFDASLETDRGYRDGGWALPKNMDLPKVASEKPMSAVKEPAPMPETKEARKAGLYYIRAGRIHTASGQVILDGAIVVEEGKIKAVGKASELPRPFGATSITATEVTPGLIDPLTCAGLSGAWNIPADQDQDEPSNPDQSDLRTLDGFNSSEPLLDWLRSIGVTTIHSGPGRVTVLSGTTGVFHSGGRTAEAAAIKPTFAFLINLGETPKSQFKDKGPGTRMATAGLVRKALADAQSYAAKKKADPDKTPRNPKAEALLPALDGSRMVIFAAHRADDIRTALRIAEEFKLKPVISLGTEAYLLADELAEKKIPVIVHPSMQRPGGSMETLNTLLANAALLKAKGVPVSIGTSFEGYVPKQRSLRHEAAIAAANGLGHAGALSAVTLDAAKLLGIDKEYGSIEAGKVADLVLFDGDPFENSTHVIKTFMSGKLVFDRVEYLKLPYDRRAFGIAGGGEGFGCCLGW